MFESVVGLGVWMKDFILGVAALLTDDWVPGAVASCLLLVAVVLGLAMWLVTRRQIVVISKLDRLLAKAKTPEHFAREYGAISATIEDWPKAGYQGRLSATWSEFRETIIEPSEATGGLIQNSVRPDEFFNSYNLGFGLGGWRFWPGFFVSVGLFLTFLGLVAALVQTGRTLDQAGAGADQALMTAALSDLLTVASAKFIMSLSGLFASILLGLVMRSLARLVDRKVSVLAHSIEHRVQFISLAELAQKQLAETVELRTHLTKLNTELIQALQKPLEEVSGRGGDAAIEMMKSVGEQLSSSLTETIADAGNQMEKAALSMGETTLALDGASLRMAATVDALTTASEGLERGATPLAASITGTADNARAIGEASVMLVEKAERSLKEQTVAVTSAAVAMQAQVEAFEARAKAYDGDMEKALKVYKDNLDAALSDVQAFSGNVHVQYADALQRLRAVIEGARSFEPEPEMPPMFGPPAPT
jgi:hypothetical protein